MECNHSVINLCDHSDGVMVLFDNLNTSKIHMAELSIDKFNQEETLRRIVPLIYLTFLVVLGIPGNIFILFIYMVKFKRKATHRTFVIALAVSDCLVCSFTIPFEIAQMTHEYTFYVIWLCKFGRTLNSMFTTSSAFNLVALSANRYRRICHPLNVQLTYNQAITCVGCIAFASAVLAIPESILTGQFTHHLQNNLTGSDCSISERYFDTIYPTIYSVGILVVYILCMISLIVMCFVIGRNIMKHIEFRDQFRLTKMFSRHTRRSRNSSAQCQDNSSVYVNANAEEEAQHKRTRSKRKTPDSPMKITRTALAVSTCFIIVFLPYIVIKLISALTNGNIMLSSVVSSILLPIISRTHFINSVSNFVIYMYMDMSFRGHCKAFFTSIASKSFKLIKTNKMQT